MPTRQAPVRTTGSNVQVYMQIEANGNAIKGGSVETNNHADWCDIYDLAYEISRNSDPATGKVTGRAFQGDFEVIKPTDQATPEIFKALCENHPVKVLIEMWRDNPSGGMRECFFKLTMDEGRVSALRTTAQADDSNDSNNPYLDTVRFSGAKMLITYVDGGIEHEHDFRVTN